MSDASLPMPIPRRWSSHSQATGDWRMDPEGQWVIWADVREVIEWAAALRDTYDRLRAVEAAARAVMAEWDALGPTGTGDTITAHHGLRGALEAQDH